jgi:hypothetical protein
MTQKLKSLNLFPEMATDAGIAGVINNINTGNFPPGLDTHTKNTQNTIGNSRGIHKSSTGSL